VPPVRPVHRTDQAGHQVCGWQRTFKSKSLEKGKWKTDKGGLQYRKIKPTFDLLLNKYTCQAAVLENWPREKRPRSPPRQEIDKVQQRELTQPREEAQHGHPPAAPSISQAANNPMGANPAFYLRAPCATYSKFPLMAPYVDQPMSYMPPMQQFQYPVWDPHMGMCVQ
jgi:hypothetical protein